MVSYEFHVAAPHSPPPKKVGPPPPTARTFVRTHGSGTVMNFSRGISDKNESPKKGDTRDIVYDSLEVVEFATAGNSTSTIEVFLWFPNASSVFPNL